MNGGFVGRVKYFRSEGCVRQRACALRSQTHFERTSWPPLLLQALRGNTVPKKAKSVLGANPFKPKKSPSTTSKATWKTKIFVLDTCVLLFDHTALTNFEENKVALPITVLEELDRFKVGNETKHFEARHAFAFWTN